MDIDELIDALSDPEAFPREASEVTVRQTHISVVFLVGERVYKIKKPVAFEFLDYSTLEKRRYYCEQEVELNRRLAPDVYLGTVPIVEDDEGLSVDEEGEVVEWAVEMVRLPDEATLDARLERDAVGAAAIEDVARRVAAFHGEADTGDEIAAYARSERVARNARDNFRQSRHHVGTTVHSEVFERLRDLNDRAIEQLRDVIDQRAESGVARDAHGDLRLDHVYLFPERQPPHDIEVVDCIEFNEAFRYGDPVGDMAFLTMDLEQSGRRDLAEQFVDAYFEASGDDEGRQLLDFYVGYRAAVRGKVEGMTAREEEIPSEQRARARQTAAAHWLLALGRLESPERRPALVLVAGLPGTGKSTVAGGLGRRAGFDVIDSDIVRKRLAGIEPDSDASDTFEGGIYSPVWSDRTYGACRVRAEQALFAGERVVIDATFYREERRRRFVELARRWGCPVVILECELSREGARERIEARSSGPSDADWSVYERVESKWESYGTETARVRAGVSTEESIEASIEEALDVLRERGLA